MAMHPLTGPRAKVGRANQLLEKLADSIIEFVGPDDPPYVARGTPDPVSGEIRIIAEPSGRDTQPPTLIALLAGEVGHQFRSALDHLVYQLFVSNNIPPPNKSAFPIFRSRAGYEARSPLMIGGLPVPAASRIESFQPYRRGDRFATDPLWILQALNNCDKHRLIPLSVISGGWLTVSFPDHRGKHAMRAVTGTIEPGMELGRLPENVPPETRIDPFFTCMLAFDELDGERNIPIQPSLRDIARHVAEVIEGFVPEFPP